MAVHLKRLNGDSTFLLTFSLTGALNSSDGSPSRDGVFTVLTDPWLAESGAPQIHAKFAYAARTVPAHVSHLSEIPAPDVVIVSQAKPDHCHEDTLRQLPADLPKTVILAHPDAAKKIRSWNYFDSAKVHTLRSFSQTDHTTIVRFTIPSKRFASSPGEATITLIKQPRDLTKLHNAVAITYRPPSGGVVHADTASKECLQIRTMLSSPALRQHDAQFEPHMSPDMLPTPPETPPESEQDPLEPDRSPVLNFSLPLRSQRQRSRTLSSLLTPSESASSQSGSVSEGSPKGQLPVLTAPVTNQAQPIARPWTGNSMTIPPLISLPPTIPLPPLPNSSPLPQVPFSSSAEEQPSIDSIAAIDVPNTSLLAPSMGNGRARSVSELTGTRSTTSGMAARTVSVLYAPHGIEFGAVKAYATTHLVQNAALPLSLILHPFVRVDNPWWLGGNISAGVPGALDIVRRLMAQHWVNAHDEEKEESGVGLLMIRKKLWSEKQVRGLLGKGMCAVRDLPCGDDMVVVA